MRVFHFFFIFSAIIILSQNKSAEEWKTRAIYQLMTDRFATTDGSEPECVLNQYCGGTHEGLRKNLDYIQNMGFDAIWISPIVKNTEGSYHSYHTIDFYDINEHFGSKEDLKNLIAECHKRDIWVMLDVVANHVGPVGFDFRTINPFNSPEHYHDSCAITDWTNQKMVENCRLCDLPDLKHENNYVADELLRWINWILKEYDIDGIRVDTVPEVPQWFWKKFNKAAGVFQIGEVFNGDPHYVASYQGCLTSVFNYPLSFTIKNSFGGGNMSLLKDYWVESRDIYPDPKILGVFIDNHDNSRFMYDYPNKKKGLDNASVLMVLFEGIPVQYYGDEQYFNGGADPNNREPLWGHYDTEGTLYVLISKSNKIRKGKKIWETELKIVGSDENYFAFTRGDVLVVLTNGEPYGPITISEHEFKEGDEICNIFIEGECITIDASMKFDLDMDGSPKVFVKKEDLKYLN